MQSSGGLTDAHAFQGKDAILSGPAGGIVGMARTAELAGMARVIGFDMGGTSTDVSHYAGEFEREFETQVAGVRMRAPMMSIHTVAAGGGSILQFDGARFRVGPQSAGANPGPASYRRGGPLAVTDANVMVGKIQPAYFPKVFGHGADEALDGEVVRERFAALAAQTGRAAEDVAEGFIQIAVQQMANAIKKISVARGYDVTRYTLQCFGGAGGQHACLVADALGMTRVFVHPLAGVLSAYGMGLADQNVIREQAVELKLALDALPEIAAKLDVLAAAAGGELARQQASAGAITTHRRVHVRYEGSDSALVVAWPEPGAGASSPVELLAAITAGFEAAYRQRFAFLMQGKGMVVEAVSVEAVVRATRRPSRATPCTRRVRCRGASTVPVYSGGRWHHAALVVREDLRSGDVIPGPAIIAEQNATTVVEPGWEATLTELDHLVLERREARAVTYAAGTTVDPVLLEVFNNLFMNIAEQMGLQLQNTAYSVNIKERLDFSCALFDADGHLIANAPHMPVHLGSMGESIKTVIRENATHHGRRRRLCAQRPVPRRHAPARHHRHHAGVPRDAAEPTFYVGSRGHHADIGGTSPGSMPPFSTRIEEEGVQINNVKLVDRGVLREAEMIALLQSGEYPSRNPAAEHGRPQGADRRQRERRAGTAQDGRSVRPGRGAGLHAPCAGQRRGVGAPGHHAPEGWRLHAGAGQRRADPGGDPRRCGQPQRHHRLHRHQPPADQQLQRAHGGLHGGGAVCVPHAGGRRHPAQRRLPETPARHHPAGSMLNPNPPASVVAGNVETSTCITNALFGALGVMAGSQPHDEQLHLRQCALPVLRDDFGRLGAGGVFDAAGRLSRWFQWHQRGPDAHDQFAPDRPGGAGIPLPGAAGELRDPPGIGRCGALAWRRRRRAARAFPGTDDGQHPVQRAGASGLRPGRRPERRAGHQLRGARRRPRGDAGPHRQRRDGGGRCVRDPHARWRRFWRRGREIIVKIGSSQRQMVTECYGRRSLSWIR
jgi:5-oxoprolinase (ATP-hydrolysing)